MHKTSLLGRLVLTAGAVLLAAVLARGATPAARARAALALAGARPAAPAPPLCRIGDEEQLRRLIGIARQGGGGAPVVPPAPAGGQAPPLCRIGDEEQLRRLIDIARQGGGGAPVVIPAPAGGQTE